MDINEDGVVIRLREQGRDRGGAVRYTPLGIYPRDEAVRIAQAKAEEFNGRAQVNDYGWYINVWVPLADDERARVERLRDVYRHARNECQAPREELRAAVVDLVAHGATEVEAARLAGVTRMTVRSWLGK